MMLVLVLNDMAPRVAPQSLLPPILVPAAVLGWKDRLRASDSSLLRQSSTSVPPVSTSATRVAARVAHSHNKTYKPQIHFFPGSTLESSQLIVFLM